ncbi:MAG: M20/M25/M40 family metallo-hydrolase [Christensenellaceae bacterium]|jgi:tripeptide aminopeptidase|nr:M20/M25/M40 family metallo-hydrolase [Christensenellaceae bacterium]
MSQTRLWETFSSLITIDSPSFKERLFCDALKERLNALGVETYEDSAGESIGGDCGNLHGFLPGSLSLPPLLFSAHMDTVEPGRGKRAVLGEEGRITSAGDTILGADDAAGIAAILEALTRLKERNLPHRPIELLFPVAEERYGLGSAVADYGRIHAKEAYTLDLGGAIGEAAHAAPTLLAFEITVTGKAAHAGFAPKEGIHAIAAAAKSIARIPVGEPEPGVTCNIGGIEGGEAANIIPALCRVSGEIRSLSHAKVLAWWEAVQAIFEEEARAAGARIAAEGRCEITAYETPLSSPVVRRFKEACQKTGVAASIHPTLGGSDQNNFAQHGIEGLVIACSMHDVHSTREYANLNEIQQCAELVLALILEEVP